MILLDTNVLIYSADPESRFHHWSRKLISQEAAKRNAMVNAIAIAELCVGESEPASVPAWLLAWGILLVDVPASASVLCAEAYTLYKARRMAASDKSAPDVPLPDFFIGAHAMVMGWDIATADRARFSTYFPTVKLITPHDEKPAIPSPS